MSSNPQGKLSHEKIVVGFPVKYRDMLLQLLETNQSTVDLGRTMVLELPNAERTSFFNIINNFVKDEIYSTYYFAKYINPRSIIELPKNHEESHFDYVHRYLNNRPKQYSYLEDKEIDILCHKSKPIKERIENPYQSFDIAEHFYPFQYPLTDSWLTRKIKEFKLLPIELNRFSFFNSPMINYKNTNDSEIYSFPESIVDKKLIDIYDKSYRISLNHTLEEILTVYCEPFHYLQQCLSKEGFIAFLYNSFEFEGNQTKLKFLNIGLNSGVTIGLFRHYLFSLYDMLDIEKPKIGFLQLVCFKYARKLLTEKLRGKVELIEQRAILDKHYINAAKNTVELIKIEREKFETKANIYPFKR